MKFFQGLGAFSVIAIIGLFIAGIIGWIMNIVTVFGMLGDVTVTTMFVARVVGIFIPIIGAVLGYI